MKYCMYILAAIILASGSFNFFSNAISGEDCEKFDENDET